MKELEVTVRIRNNRLKERRDLLGFTQVQLAHAAGVYVHTYTALENMRQSPRSDSGWSKAALTLARFHCVPVTELFPKAVLSVEATVATRKVDASDFDTLLSSHQERAIAGPHAMAESAAMSRALHDAVSRLDERRQRVLSLRFGLAGGEPMTREEVGIEIGVGAERVKQLEADAIRKLRNPRLIALRELRGVKPPRT